LINESLGFPVGVKVDVINTATIYAGVFAVIYAVNYTINYAPVPTEGTRAGNELKDRFSSKERLSFVVFKKR
jgi:hypothetical protein